MYLILAACQPRGRDAVLTSIWWEDLCQSHVCVLITQLSGIWLLHLTVMGLTWEHCFFFCFFFFFLMSFNSQTMLWAIITSLRNMSSSCLSDGLALMLHTDCTVNESVYHTSVADLFQLMELFGHKLLFWPYWAAVLLLVSERLHHTTSFFQLTMNLFFLTQHPPPNLFHAFLKSEFFFLFAGKKKFFFSFFLNFFSF